MSRPAAEPRRQLHRGHFAFMRALTQGLDARQSWERYLRVGSEQADTRQVRQIIGWIRDAFAAAARREQRPGTARLILLDPDRFFSAPNLPTLEEFAAAEGLEDFSEAEQVEAYEAAHPDGGGAGQGGGAGASRRTRVIARQLEALRWLETLVARDPRPSDGVGGWLNPAVSTRLERAGFATLADLVQNINSRGARWWRAVPGVGAGKASRILEWLQAHEAELGMAVGLHGRRPRRSLPAATLASVEPATTSLVPFEKFVLPEDLSGRQGRFRAPANRCRLPADDDHAAIGAWLAAKSPQRGPLVSPQALLSATQRAYRREAERLLLWAVLERRTAISSLTQEDADAFRVFVTAPPQAWCGPRHGQRWSSLWRPLEGPLSASALRQTLTILRSLYGYLIDEGYVLSNPFAGNAPPPLGRPSSSTRSLSREQWNRVNARLAAHGDSEPARRLRRGMRWIQATGLRISEITAARCGDLQHVNSRTAAGASCTRWLLNVSVNSASRRQVPVPTELVSELQQEITRWGFEPDPSAMRTRDLAILARFDPQGGCPSPWSASGLYQATKSFLVAAANDADEIDASLNKASAHWLRNIQTVGRT